MHPSYAAHASHRAEKRNGINGMQGTPGGVAPGSTSKPNEVANSGESSSLFSTMTQAASRALPNALINFMGRGRANHSQVNQAIAQQFCSDITKLDPLFSERLKNVTAPNISLSKRISEMLFTHILKEGDISNHSQAETLLKINTAEGLLKHKDIFRPKNEQDFKNVGGFNVWDGFNTYLENATNTDQQANFCDYLSQLKDLTPREIDYMLEHDWFSKGQLEMIFRGKKPKKEDTPGYYGYSKASADNQRSIREEMFKILALQSKASRSKSPVGSRKRSISNSTGSPVGQKRPRSQDQK